MHNVARISIEGVKIVICREDFPLNSGWKKEGYPSPHCWDPEELTALASKLGKGSDLWREANRIWWEFWHRYHGTYRRGRPLPKVYICAETCVEIDQLLPSRRIVSLIFHMFAISREIYRMMPTYA